MLRNNARIVVGPETIRTAGRARHGRGISGALRAATRRSAERYPGARVRLRAGARGPPPPRARLAARAGTHAADAPRLATPVATCQTRRPSSPRTRSSREVDDRRREKRAIVTAERAALNKGRLGGTTWRTKGRDATRTRVPDRSPAILRSSQQRRPQPAVSGRRRCTTAPGLPLKLLSVSRARRWSRTFRDTHDILGVTHPGVY